MACASADADEGETAVAAWGRRHPSSLRPAVWAPGMEPGVAADERGPGPRRQVLPGALEELPPARDQEGLPHRRGAAARHPPPGQARQQVEEDRRGSARAHGQAAGQVVGGVQGEAAAGDQGFTAAAPRA